MKLIFAKRFEKDIDKIKQDALKLKLSELLLLLKSSEDLLEIPNLKKLKGAKSAYRIRIGDFRICFYLEAETLKMARVLHRKEVYKYFP